MEIARNGVAPETGLPPAVVDDDARFGAQRRIGIDHRAGKVSIELRIGLCSIELSQEHLAMCPRQLKDTIRDTPVLVFLHKAQAHVTSLADAGANIDRCRFFRIEGYPIPYSDYRIED